MDGNGEVRFHVWSRHWGPAGPGEAEAASSLQNSLGSYVSDVRSTQPKGTGLGGVVGSSVQQALEGCGGWKGW